MLHKKRASDKKATYEDRDAIAGYDAFEHYYQDVLLDDAKKPPREIDLDALKPKKLATIVRSDSQQHGYLNEAARREKFLEEHKLYKEGRLESKERAELFFVFE